MRRRRTDRNGCSTFPNSSLPRPGDMTHPRHRRGEIHRTLSIKVGDAWRSSLNGSRQSAVPRQRDVVGRDRHPRRPQTAAQPFVMFDRDLVRHPTIQRAGKRHRRVHSPGRRTKLIGPEFTVTTRLGEVARVLQIMNRFQRRPAARRLCHDRYRRKCAQKENTTRDPNSCS